MEKSISRSIQEFVPGKQVTLAHLIAHPTDDLSKKIGVPGADAIGIMTLTPRVQQLLTQVPEFIRGRLEKCHYSKVSCSGNRGFERFNAVNIWACSVLVVDSPALG